MCCYLAHLKVQCMYAGKLDVVKRFAMFLNIIRDVVM